MHACVCMRKCDTQNAGNNNSRHNYEHDNGGIICIYTYMLVCVLAMSGLVYKRALVFCSRQIIS